MFQSYIQVALRAILANKVYGLINIVGLAIGLTACILIMLFVRDEYSFDQFWAKSDNIYRLHTTFNVPGRQPFVTGSAQGPTKEALKGYFPEEVEKVTRFAQMQPVVKYQNKVFYERVHWTDPEMLDIFDLDVVAGSLTNALSDNSSIALNQSMAQKYFGDEIAVGKVLTMTTFGVVRDYRVAAVFQDLSHNTVLSFQALTRIDEQDFTHQPALFSEWFSLNNWVYFTLKSGADISKINAQLSSFADAVIITPGAFEEGTKPSDFVTYSTMALTGLQLNGPGGREMKPVGDQQTVMIFIAIAGLILLIACINFTNLATAKSTQRAREVALRKVLGAKRKQLIQQFVGESILLATISLLLAIVFVELLLPFYGQFLGRVLSFDYTGPFGLAALGALAILVGLVAGLYPALFLSGFRPARVLKANRSTETKGSSRLRSGLVVVQFAISIALIIATGVVFGQMVYANSKDPGFNKENLLVVRNVSRDGIVSKQQTLKEEILRLPGVISAAYSGDAPANNNEANSSVSIPGNPEAGDILIGRQLVDEDFFPSYEIPIIAGRNYNRDLAQDGVPDFSDAEPGDVLNGTLIVNEAALKRLGFGAPDEAIGKTVQIRSGGPGGPAMFANLEVVGVAADTHFKSLRQLVRPEMYYLVDNNFRNLTVRYTGDPTVLLAKIGAVWQQVAEDVPFSHLFVDEAMARQYLQEQSLATMLGTFASLAVLVACMGLYGLAAFTAERRTREIGIRKVMGARVFDIVRLLVWQFSKPVIIANIIAWPVAAWSMMMWLESFPYRLDAWVLVPLCIIAGFIALAIAWATVGGNAARVARANPIKALRYE